MKRAVSAMISLLIVCATAYALSPEQVNRINQLREMATKYFNEGNYEKAIPLFNEMLAIDHGDRVAAKYLQAIDRQVIEPYCEQAAGAYMSGNYTEAILHWEKILQINPNDRRVMGLIEETVDLSSQGAVSSLYEAVDRSLKEGKYEAAIDGLEKILLTKPDEQRALGMLKSIKQTFLDSVIKRHYEQAEAHMAKKDYDAAITSWKEILKIDDSQALASRLIASAQRNKLDSLYGKAKSLSEKGDYIASRDAYYQIIGANPTDNVVKGTIDRLSGVINVVPKIDGGGQTQEVLRKALANYISEEGNPKASVVASWYAVQIDPNNSLALAVRDFIEKQNVGIIRTLDGPTGDMNIIEQYLFIALNHIYDGRYDLAIQKCGIVLELQPGNLMALKRLGSAYFAMGRKDKAREAWEKALRIAPSDGELVRFIQQTR